MTDAATVWKRLRLKVDPTADDADWAGLQLTPNRLTAVVGGTTAAGVYSITVLGKVWKPGHNRMGPIDVNFTATFTRAGAETDAQIADELENDFDAGTVTVGSSVTLASVGITADVSSATITIVFPPHCELTITTVAPGGATITLPEGAIMPITASAPHFKRSGEDSVTGILCCLFNMDDAGATLLVPGGTVTVEAVELIELETVNDRGDRTYAYRVAGLGDTASVAFGVPFVVPLRGAKFWTLRIHTDAALTANTDSIEVVYRDAVE